MPLKVDAIACARNYFSRPSAPEYEDEDDDEERGLIMQDLKMLRKVAADYLHPERPVEVDPTCFGRNYFNRPSAPEKDTFYEAEQRALILAEMAELKKYAVDYLHPEIPVTTSDPAAFGRNYFTRPSAPEQEDEEYVKEKESILKDMTQLKKLAGDYLHPERPLTSDPAVFGRNYFTRPSAPEPLDMEEEEEKHRILEEMAAMKQYAGYYMHPELPVDTSDPTRYGRNYFTRPSAPEQLDEEEEEEKTLILEEMVQLKKLAVDYLHPELPVITSDPTVFGRNYFTRPSAPETENDEMAEERARILADAAALKQKALDYLHPELPVITSDPTAFGRSYFTRPSAPGVNEFVHSVILEHDEDDELYIERTGEPSHHDLYYHHAHFDMDDDIHLHHVEFDRDTDYHEEITEVRHAVSGFVEHIKPEDEDDHKLSSSPECVMFAHFKQPHHVV